MYNVNLLTALSKGSCEPESAYPNGFDCASVVGLCLYVAVDFLPAVLAPLRSPKPILTKYANFEASPLVYGIPDMLPVGSSVFSSHLNGTDSSLSVLYLRDDRETLESMKITKSRVLCTPASPFIEIGSLDGSHAM